MKEYLLDTNAYFNYLKETDRVENHAEPGLYEAEIEELKSKQVYISRITQVEIISVLGSYARGGGGCDKCKRKISPEGAVCSNHFYTPVRKKWSNRKITVWKKLIKETMNGTSGLLRISVLSFDMNTIQEAQKIIEHSLIHNFASMDAMIAATAQIALNSGKEMVVVTSDKGLKCCLNKCGIPVWDAFAVVK